MWPSPKETADLVTVTKEIFNGKLDFYVVRLAELLCSVNYMCSRFLKKIYIIWLVSEDIGHFRSSFREFLAGFRWF